jgi:hypothetical protein
VTQVSHGSTSVDTDVSLLLSVESLDASGSQLMQLLLLVESFDANGAHPPTESKARATGRLPKPMSW